MPARRPSPSEESFKEDPFVDAKSEGVSVNRLEKHDFLYLDKVCTEFEAEWNTAWSLDDFRSYLFAKSQPTSAEFIELFCELAQIDIERRWKHFADGVNQSAADETGQFQAALAAVPRYRTYLNAVDFTDDSRAFISDLLAKCELRARCKFGDAPQAAEYGLAAEAADLKKILPIVSINDSSGTVYESPFYSPLEVGRQDIDETVALGLLTDGPKLKLVCASLTDTSISRQQFTIRIIAGKRVQIENQSGNRWFVVAHGTHVAPQSIVSLQLPVTVDLQSLTLRFRRPIYE